MSEGLRAAPKSALAWWALALAFLGPAAGFFVGFAASGVADISDEVSVALMVAIGVGLATAGAVCGVLAIVKGERSIVSWLALLVAAVGAFYLLASTGTLPMGGDEGGGELPARPADVPYAEVLKVSRAAADGTITLRVESQEEGAAYDAATVRVDDTTAVYRQTLGGLEPAGAETISTSQRVDVWLTGPVAESYPVQAKAEAVLILAR